ncbi:MAG: AIR synthase related protein, partial [Bacteroidota bacterium]
MEDKKLRDLAELGEFGLIEKLTEDFQLKNKNSLLGVGDDAAEIKINDEESLLVSTDTLIEGIHFNLMYMPLKFLGYKAVSVNV